MKKLSFLYKIFTFIGWLLVLSSGVYLYFKSAKFEVPESYPLNSLLFCLFILILFVFIEGYKVFKKVQN